MSNAIIAACCLGFTAVLIAWPKLRQPSTTTEEERVKHQRLLREIERHK